MITINQAQLTGAGINLSDVGETLYVYQGTNADTPSRFLHAVDIADGTAALRWRRTAQHRPGQRRLRGRNLGRQRRVRDAHAQHPVRRPVRPDQQQHRLGPERQQSAGRHQPTPAAIPRSRRPTHSWWVAGSGAGEGIVTINLDANYNSGTLAYQIVQAFQNDANLFHPSDITLDTVHGKFFFVDSDISGGHNRIIEGSISQLLNNPGAAGTFNVLYSDTGTAAANSIRTLSVDTTNGIIYFDHGTTFNKVTYSLNGTSTSGQTPTVLANLGSNNYVTQVTIDFTRGEVFLGSSRIQSVFGSDAITKNYIYVATGLTAGSRNPELHPAAVQPR